MDFIFSHVSIIRGTAYWHYIPSSGYIAEKAEVIEVVAGCSMIPECPGCIYPTVLVFHAMKNQMLPDDVEASYLCTKDFRRFVLMYWHDKKLIRSLFGGRYDSLIKQIVDDEYNSIREEISKNIPEVVGFSVLHFRSRKVVLVHDLTEGAKYPVIDVLPIRGSRTGDNKENVRAFLKRLYEKAGEKIFSKTKILIPYNYDLYLILRSFNEDYCIINFGIPSNSKSPNPKASEPVYIGVQTIHDEMNDCVSDDCNALYNEILRRHQILSYWSMPRSVDELRKKFILLF